MTINIDDKIYLKKNHPSKTAYWIVVRTGTIFKLRSNLDENLILEFTKDKLIKIIKKIESRK
ncbi:DUF951 family protein [Spiroplasma diminutum]|uniref:Uncharacterized protein n=1 Tax=Spiroplasma diminutum CUAS-1 TaxID=1276221 RepID=S5M0Z7_9MOLU|nr:DUF951 family protein [Spiroplasma diminutum]AGR42531.1 hypothetical protein SDIMI_v3c08270 [Spiroplasma diminutum CUAS-1]